MNTSLVDGLRSAGEVRTVALHSVGWVPWDPVAGKRSTTRGGSSTTPHCKVYPTEARAKAYSKTGEAKEVFVRHVLPRDH